MSDAEFGCKGQRRRIPAEIRRAVRQAAKFGCCACGCPIIEYHHIEPFSESRSHLFSNIVALCPTCHAQADAGGPWSPDLVREYKSKPWNTDLASAKFAVSTRPFRVRLGHWEFRDCDDILALGDEVVLRARRDKSGIVRVSGTFQTPEGDPFALIDENEWQVSVGHVWDVEYISARHLIVRRAPRDIILRMDITDSALAVTQGFFRKGDALSLSVTGDAERTLVRAVSLTGAKTTLEGSSDDERLIVQGPLKRPALTIR